ncbi:hypothetical protein [Mumia sp. DW29H23]|uniref:hypothetical protein n=1 Tax=Mumia sp. DW29H23 TaxID=3421241 RepID=UPI003D68D105
MSDLIPSLIRTYVPLAVGWLVGLLAAVRIDVSTSGQLALASLLGGVAALGYYLAARWLTTRVPSLSWLLGTPTAPTYGGPSVSNLLPAIIRTTVPLLVSTAASWLLSLGVTIGTDLQLVLITAIGGLTSAGYYALARELEERWPILSPLLLGSRYTPTYGDGQ